MRYLQSLLYMATLPLLVVLALMYLIVLLPFELYMAHVDEAEHDLGYDDLGYTPMQERRA